MSSPLLNGSTVPQLMRAVTTATAAGAARLAAADIPHSPADHDQLRSMFDRVDLNEHLRDLDSAIDEIDRLWLQNAVWFHHPQAIAHLNCPVALPAVAADALAATVNTSMDTWDQSKGATLIERKILAWTAEQIGFPRDADGMFTPGGTTSNLQALMLARDESLQASGRIPGAAPRPVRAARLRILASAESHFSVVTAARILGLDDDAVVTVPVDADGRMCVAALNELVDGLEQQGLTALAVVATAGTTDRGVVDPLDEIAALCRTHKVWLHVDGAYGGGLLASTRHRGKLAGIQHADSVTIDFHKTWFQPVSCSVVMVREGRTLRHCTHHAAYLNPADTPEPNQVDRSLQTTRRFDALKIWLTLRTLGAEVIGDMLDQVIELAQKVADTLEQDPRFELVCRPSLSTVLFRWLPSDGTPPDDLVRAIRRRVWESGHATIAETVIEGRPCLKITLLNPEATHADVMSVMTLIHRAGQSLLAPSATYREAAV